MSMGSFGPPAYEAPAAMLEEGFQCSKLTKSQRKRMKKQARKQAQNSTETTAALPAEASADPPPHLGHRNSARGGADTTSTTSRYRFGPAYEALVATDWFQRKCNNLTKAQKKRVREQARKQTRMDEPRPPSVSTSSSEDNSVAQKNKPVADSFPCQCSVCWRSSKSSHVSLGLVD